MYDVLLGIVGGAISGFLTSLYFWNKNRKKERPRILVEGKGQGFLDPQNGYPFEAFREAVFYVRNEGSTYAEKILVSNKNTGEKIKMISELKPDGTEYLTIIKYNKSLNIEIKYQDVWGKEYKSIWSIEGPHFIRTNEEGDTEVVDYSATKSQISS